MIISFCTNWGALLFGVQVEGAGVAFFLGPFMLHLGRSGDG